MPASCSYSAQRYSIYIRPTAGRASPTGGQNDAAKGAPCHGRLLPPPFSLLPLDLPNADELYAFTLKEPTSAETMPISPAGGDLSAAHLPVSVKSTSSSNERRRSPSLTLSLLSGRSSSSRSSPLTSSPLSTGHSILPRIRSSSKSSDAFLESQTPPVQSVSSLLFARDRKGKKKDQRFADLSTVSIHTLVETEEAGAEKAEEARWKHVQARASEIAATMFAQDICNAASVFHDFSEAFEQDLVRTSHVFSSHTQLLDQTAPSTQRKPSSVRPSNLGSFINRLSLRSRKKTSGTQAMSTVPSQFSLLSLRVPEDEVATDWHAKTASSFSWSWGCCARAVWAVRPATASAATLEVASVDADRGRVIDCRDPRLTDWSEFLRLYAQGCLDLSFTPPFPNEGFSELYDRDSGRLEAPDPLWEASRCRMYHRLQLNELDVDSLRLISDQVAACGASLSATRTLLQCIDGHTIWRLTVSGLKREVPSRQESMCAHTILNQNRGLMVENLEADWRFDMSEEGDDLSSYAGMPVLAANGLPVAVLSVWDRNLDLSETTVETLRCTAREIGRVFENHHRREWQVKMGRMAVSIKELQEKVGKVVTRQCSSLQQPSSIDSRKSSSSSGASSAQHRPGWTTTYDGESLELLAENGMLMSLEDVERMRYLLGEMSLQIEMEAMYVAAVCTGDGELRINGRIHLLSVHNLPDSRPSDSFYQLTFASTEAEDDDENNDQRYILELCEAHEEFSKIQPLEGDLFRSILVIPLARRGTLGFTLGALTQDREKAIGVEDLRYLQALRPILCEMIAKFEIAFRSAQLEAEYDAKRKQESQQQRAKGKGKGSNKDPLLSQAEIKKQRRRRPVTPLELFLMGSTDQAGLKPPPRPRRTKSAPLAKRKTEGTDRA